MGHFEKCVLAARRGAVQCVAGSSLATLIMPCIVQRGLQNPYWWVENQRRSFIKMIADNMIMMEAWVLWLVNFNISLLSPTRDFLYQMYQFPIII